MRTTLSSQAEQTTISDWKQKQKPSCGRAAVEDMSKQRGAHPEPPFENTLRMATQKHSQHTVDETRFIRVFFVFYF